MGTGKHSSARSIALGDRFGAMLAKGRLGLPPRPAPHTWISFGIVAATIALNLLQQPGLITFDTKLDLQFDPGGFMERSLSLWNGDSAVGGLQNQASGYLFPMGPAFLLGHSLGVPMWVWERLWSAVVMLLAYGGARRLAAHWPGIGATGAVIAGAAYMLSPRVLTTVGGLSGETLPGAVLPWTVLPLVLYLRGRWRALPALVVSAATIPFMGGQNATLVLACLILPGLLLALTEGRPWTRRLRDLSVWSVLVLCVIAWWLVPLLLMGSYAPPFLDFIESSRNTAASTNWMSSIRGTNHWVAFFPDGGDLGWVGGYELASSELLAITTVLTAAAGLIGLLLSGTWQRRVLIVSILTGSAILTAGSGGWAGSILSEWWLQGLDGSLAPLRNVHKFDPLMRLPLCLGIGVLVSSVPLSWSKAPATRAIPLRTLVLAGCSVVLLAATIPAASGHLRTSNGMVDLSPAWRQAADYLDDQEGPVRAIVLPGAGFAVQTWGRTVDEPIQVLDTPPWLARAQVTVAPGATLRLMGGIADAVDRARPQPSLIAALERLGITHVVVRNDLDPVETDAPSPAVVDATVTQSPRLQQAAAFGRGPDGRAEVEVLALPGNSDPRIEIADWSTRRSVSGGPEAVADLVAAGLLSPSQPAVLVGPEQQADVVTDSNRRVERNFGRVHAAVSTVMTAGDRFRVDRRAHDLTDSNVPSEQTTAVYSGATEITASTSGGYADVFGPVRPEEHPYAAFDGSLFTAWTTAPLSEAEGQWIEVRFETEQALQSASLTFDHLNGAVVRSIRLSTEAGSVTSRVAQDGIARDVKLPAAGSRWLRITILDTVGSQEQVKLAHVQIGDRTIRRALRLPGRIAPDSAVHLSAEQPRRACVTTSRGLACEQGRQLETPETDEFQRLLTFDGRGEWTVGGRVVATNGLGRIGGSPGPSQVSIEATSIYAGDPAAVAANAFDGSPQTSWYASPHDPAPALALTWRGQRSISSVLAVLDPAQPGDLPRTLVVDPVNGVDQPQLVTTTGPDAGRLANSVRTDQLRISFLDETGVDGIGVAELRISGLAPERNTSSEEAQVLVACGDGPSVQLGDRSIETRVVGSLADISAGRELDLRPCGREPLAGEPGEQQLRVTNPQGFAVTELWLTPTARTETAPGPQPLAEVTKWTPTSRTVHVNSEQVAVLSIPESHNAGWTARVDGRQLESVVLDGWKQGWLVPASARGSVVLSFAPQASFLVAIVMGLGAAGLVMLAAAVLLVVQSRRGRPSNGRSTRGPIRERGLGRLGQGTGLVVLGLVSIPLAAGAVIGSVARRWSIVAVSLCCLAALATAALLTLVAGSPIDPPAASDILVALVVGVVSGRTLTESNEGDRHVRPRSSTQ